MEIVNKEVTPVSFIVRDALANDASFRAARHRLYHATTAIEVNVTIGGAKERVVVIIKGRFAPRDTWILKPGSGRWFGVETNYDHWTTQPLSDNKSDTAVNAMIELGRKDVSLLNLFQDMSTTHVLNSNTVYHVVMSAAEPSLMQTWIRI